VGQQTTAELAIGSEFAGYRIEEVAARGGMGVVYRAIQLRLERTVALKLVTPALARDTSFRERFKRESMVAASIDHPNVIPVYEAGEEDGALYIAMRWVEGTDLREMLDRGALEPSRAARFVSQAANALDAAHERGLIHRDVKPANILITGQDHVYLTDFGLTKHASSISGLTRTGQWVGTVDYTAPEQIEGATVSARTDVYSLGCVLFEALTGRTPYERENDLAKLWAHMYTPPPSVLEVSPDIPARFDGIVQRAMAKDPAERYASAGELGGAVLSAAREAEAPAREKFGPADAPSDQPIPQPAGARRPLGRGRRVLFGLVGLLVLAAAVLAIVYLPGSDQSETDGTTASPSPQLRTASTWSRLPSMPTARQNTGSTVLDGTIWVMGGLGNGSIGSRRVEGYDPVINGWKAGPDLPVRLHHQMVVTYKGEVVVIGGWIPKGSNPSAETSDRVFALRGGSWVRLPSLQRPRAAGAVAVVGDRIVVVGGQADGRLVDATEVFDGKRWSTGANIPTPREHLAAASDGDFVFAVGGRALSPDKNSAALERYDPASDRWQRLPDMPTARGGLGAAIADGHLLAVGGETPTRVLGQVESYSLASKSWSRAPSMRTPRHGIAVAAIERSLYSLGGAPRPGHASASGTTEVLSLVPARATGASSPSLRAGSTWRRLPSMPTARQNMASTVLDGTIWVMGGLGSGSIGSRRVEGYDPVINGWKAGPNLPARLHHEMAVTYKDEVVVIGGWIPDGSNPSAETSGRVYALRGGRWVILPSLKRPRAAGAAAVVGDRIVVVGGQTGGRLVDATEVFDGKKWSVGANMPTPREHLAATSDGKSLYAVGGRALSPDKNSEALERYDPATDRWQRLPDMPTARGGLGAAIAGGRLFALGGETPTRVLGQVESYSLASKSWSSAPSMRTPRHGLGVIAIERSLYSLGGAPRPGHASATGTTEVLRLTR
jgi:serine/threonine protein kinase/N-acetylneuraminic acid mutarotase